jgi:tetratricopeptide (TPR) repeat protein
MALSKTGSRYRNCGCWRGVDDLRVVAIGLLARLRDALASHHSRDLKQRCRARLSRRPALRKDRIEESRSQAEEALRIQPNNSDAQNNLALALFREGRLREAGEHWKRSLELKPTV